MISLINNFLCWWFQLGIWSFNSVRILGWNLVLGREFQLQDLAFWLLNWHFERLKALEFTHVVDFWGTQSWRRNPGHLAAPQLHPFLRILLVFQRRLQGFIFVEWFYRIGSVSYFVCKFRGWRPFNFFYVPEILVEGFSYPTKAWVAPFQKLSIFVLNQFDLQIYDWLVLRLWNFHSVCPRWIICCYCVSWAIKFQRHGWFRNNLSVDWWLISPVLRLWGFHPFTQGWDWFERSLRCRHLEFARKPTRLHLWCSKIIF